MTGRSLRSILFSFAFCASGLGVRAQEIVATASAPNAVYRAGDTARWDLEIRGAGAESVTHVRFAVKRNGLQPIREGVLPLVNGRASLEARLEEPGTLLVEMRPRVRDIEIDVRSYAGAAFSPEKLKPSLPRPRDFDRFWRAKLGDLANVPSNPQLETVDVGRPSIDYYRITMDNIRGSKIHGQLARPAGEGKCPALLIVQWAGVYPLNRDWVTSRAEAGWLVLNIMAHDLPFDRPQSFYEETSRTTLANYPAIGNDDRDTSYFLRMYLSCYRAAEYLTKRPDWDGKTLVVTGASQGGMQTLVTAALHPKITAGIADVPAGCDLNGPEAGRAPGWPMWYFATQGKDEKRVRAASRYYDVVNFASRIKVPMLIGLGLVDTVCPAPGVFTTANQLKGRREVVIMPQTGHGGDHGPYYRRAEDWLNALVRGRAPAN